MKVYEYGIKDVMKEQEPITQKFIARMIMNDVKKIAREKGIDEETAYWGYMHGLYGGDRELG